jgi:hypothetical protein
MKIRTLTEAGREAYRQWLETRKPGELPSSQLVDGPDWTASAIDVELDLDRVFETRLEFGRYIAKLLEGQNARALLKQAADGVWDWITVAYFAQFGRKMSRSWHYTVTRRGHSGSLAYRHLARTAFEMYWRHGEASRVMLRVDMATWGDLAEQLTSRQTVAYHRGYIKAANALYLADGKLVRGAASRVRPRAKRKPGETRGRGGVARLALAVRRLSRTYDTHVLSMGAMMELLPKEFQHFAARRMQKAIAESGGDR